MEGDKHDTGASAEQALGLQPWRRAARAALLKGAIAPSRRLREQVGSEKQQQSMRQWQAATAATHGGGCVRAGEVRREGEKVDKEWIVSWWCTVHVEWHVKEIT